MNELKEFKEGDLVRHRTTVKYTMMVIGTGRLNNQQTKEGYICRWMSDDGLSYRDTFQAFELVKTK